MFRIRRSLRDLVGRSHGPPLKSRLPQQLPLPGPTRQTAIPDRTISINSLPAEVIDQIFDKFDNDGDLDSIKACTVVCQDWCLLSQPRLFHTIVLHIEDLEYSVYFRQFILSSPHISPAVRHVSLHFPKLGSWLPDSRQTSNLIADILEVLPRPESLKVFGPRFSDRIKWTRLPLHLKNSIITILRRQTLTEFLIDGWILDVNILEFHKLFSCASSLKRLSLLDISEGIWGPIDNVQPATAHIVLDELTLSNTFAKDHKLIDWLCHPESVFDLQKLKTLRVMESRDDSYVSKLTDAIVSSLETLEVNLNFTTEEFISLSRNSGLRRLSLSFGVFYTELYFSSLPWICDTLATIPLDSKLEELSLSLYITHPRNTNVRVFPPPPVNRFNYEMWARLGNAILHQKFSSMTKITIELIHHGIDVRAYSALAALRLGEEINSKIVWRYLRDESPDLNNANPFR